MNNPELPPPPKDGLLDKALGIAKAIVGDVVPLGGTLAELAGSFFRTPYQKRVDEWQAQVGEVLSKLATDRGVDLTSLQEDAKFLDTVLHATQIAMRNSNKEKRRALRNALLNSALPAAPDEAQRLMFLRYVDILGPLHLALLDLFDDPGHWFRRRGIEQPNLHMGARQHVLETAFVDARAKRDIYTQAWRDLFQSGLTSVDSLDVTMTGHGLMQGATSALGKRFLTFIREPTGKKA